MSLVNILHRCRFTTRAPTSHAQAGRNKQKISMEMEKAFTTNAEEVCGCGGNQWEQSFFFRCLAICNHASTATIGSRCSSGCSFQKRRHQFKHSRQSSFLFILCHMTGLKCEQVYKKLEIKVQQVDDRMGNVVSFSTNRFLEVSLEGELTCCSFSEPT